MVCQYRHRGFGCIVFFWNFPEGVSIHLQKVLFGRQPNESIGLGWSRFDVNRRNTTLGHLIYLFTIGFCVFIKHADMLVVHSCDNKTREAIVPPVQLFYDIWWIDPCFTFLNFYHSIHIYGLKWRSQHYSARLDCSHYHHHSPLYVSTLPWCSNWSS